MAKNMLPPPPHHVNTTESNDNERRRNEATHSATAAPASASATQQELPVVFNSGSAGVYTGLEQAVAPPFSRDNTTSGFIAPDFQTGAAWPSPGQSLMYATNNDPAAASVDFPHSPFNYLPYSEDQHEQSSEGRQMLYEPTNREPPVEYPYNWNADSNAASFGSDAGRFSSRMEHGGSSVSLDTLMPGMFAASSSGGGGPNASLYGNPANVYGEVGARDLGGDNLAATGVPGDGERRPPLKRVKTLPNRTPNLSRARRAKLNTPDVPAWSTQTPAGSSGESSQSGSTINAQMIPDNTTDDGRGGRRSHNLVEKQYRNRLNAQFEGLMRALPQDVKAPGSGPGTSDEGFGGDAMEKRLSKAEVLEMARLHIQALEQERDDLIRERDQLQGNADILQGLYAGGVSDLGEGGGEDKSKGKGKGREGESTSKAEVEAEAEEEGDDDEDDEDDDNEEDDDDDDGNENR
ncbi:Helix-loop-helix DNA-binding protein [Niveomyces insectorum RCEF 264]|uniref:Helix-loop-helix DNA-binding protein n=1 Tax=Niveomyces insectorum RCEF 264 TaxID=1081102 RepID=A0A167M237_9HYPO|nr:Helix-loop-helix DNA-binding protein [Niveomyces insectorum RCEF 264]